MGGSPLLYQTIISSSISFPRSAPEEMDNCLPALGILRILHVTYAICSEVKSESGEARIVTPEESKSRFREQLLHMSRPIIAQRGM